MDFQMLETRMEMGKTHFVRLDIDRCFEKRRTQKNT